MTPGVRRASHLPRHRDRRDARHAHGNGGRQRLRHTADRRPARPGHHDKRRRQGRGPQREPYNSNTNVVTDTRTWNELLNMYTEMEATGPSAQTSINTTIAPTRGGQTQDYQTYWNFRNQESDDYVGGLTQGQTYYVVINSADPGTIRLSLTPERDAGQHYGLAQPGQRRRRRRPAAPLHRRRDLRHLRLLVIYHQQYDRHDQHKRHIGGGGLTNGEEVTFERYVPYDRNYRVTLSANQQTAYTAYYTQQGQAQGLAGSCPHQLCQQRHHHAGKPGDPGVPYAECGLGAGREYRGRRGQLRPRHLRPELLLRLRRERPQRPA